MAAPALDWQSRAIMQANECRIVFAERPEQGVGDRAPASERPVRKFRRRQSQNCRPGPEIGVEYL